MSKRTDRIFGLHVVKQTLANAPETVLNAWVQESIESETMHSIQTALKNLRVSIQSVPRLTLSKMVKNQNHQGVILEVRTAARKTEHDLDDVLAQHRDSKPLYLVLDSIQDPHNLGACIRTAAAVGVTAVIIPNDRAAGINETVHKVASGAVENVMVIRVVNLVRALKKIKKSGVWVVGTAGNAEQSIYDLDLNIPTAIVMGSEAKGMRDSIQKECDYTVALPIYGPVESLNVSVAAGVVLYEVARQRRVDI